MRVPNSCKTANLTRNTDQTYSCNATGPFHHFFLLNMSYPILFLGSLHNNLIPHYADASVLVLQVDAGSIGDGFGQTVAVARAHHYRIVRLNLAKTGVA